MGGSGAGEFRYFLVEARLGEVITSVLAWRQPCQDLKQQQAGQSPGPEVAGRVQGLEHREREEGK